MVTQEGSRGADDRVSSSAAFSGAGSDRPLKPDGLSHVARRRFISFLLAAPLILAAPPQRIVSTAPSITEMLYALGLGDRVVGVTRYCRYPPEAQLKPKIGDYTSPNLEAIAALKPDLVIIQTNPARLAERLGALRLKSLEIDQENIAALYNSIRVVGDATGVPARATQLTESMRSKLEQIRQRASALPPTRVMFVIGRTPGRLDGLVVVGKASYLNEIMQIAGGVNVFRDAVAAYPQVSLEEVLARNPQVIVDMGDMSDTVDVTEAHKRDVVGLWQRMGKLDAVTHHRVSCGRFGHFRGSGAARGECRAGVSGDAALSFRAAGLGFSYGLHDVSCELPASGLVAITGPNGAGKSTLLGILAGLRSPYRGSCTYRGVEVRAWKRREFARRVAFLPQSLRIQFPFTAKEVVLMGRTPYSHGWMESTEDEGAVERAMEVTDTREFASRDFRSLSGGEAQRVILAAALAQQPDTLLLDEPTTYLDLKHQFSLYRLLSGLAQRMLVVAVTHDLNLALQFAGRVLVLDRGQLAGDGPPAEVFQPERIAQVFGVRAEMHGRYLTYES